MARYRTPAGVVIEMKDDAARAVGYEPAETERKPRARRKRAVEKVVETSSDVDD